MADSATIRLNKVLRELNISLDRAVEYLATKGHDVVARPTTKISNEVYQVLLDEFQTDMSKKVASKEVGEEKRKEKEAIRLQLEKEQEEKRLAREQRAAAREVVKAKVELSGPKKGRQDRSRELKKSPNLNQLKRRPKKAPVAKKEPVVEPQIPPQEEQKTEDPETIATKYKKLSGTKDYGRQDRLVKIQ